MLIRMHIKHFIISTILITAASGSALHGPCEGNEQCGTLDTYCKNDTCVCKDDFVIYTDHCIQLATPHIHCKHKSNCNAILGHKGFCKNQRCVCKSFHHLHNNQCIKSKGLDENCDNDHQCYCGQGCNDKIECANGMCVCKRGFKMYGRRCIPDPSFVKTQEETPPSGCGNLIISYSIPGLLTVIFFTNFHYWY